ncbi:Endoglucanase [Quillaja saponaria]|uniref:Endoglucanase n=1 Tax=Quillaja saponaria TaxID=32244 RepID=A0AAD7PBP0_QUISA|nr:Endoglucanase [Quillaja saponaria]
MGALRTVLLVLTGLVMATAAASHNYGEALMKSILFFEGQRSGRLPSTQRMTWRKNSALRDGLDVHRDMVGGYYDAGDNVKFHFPMAFTTTMLAWSVVEFGNLMDSELQHALEAVRWGTDYFLKATRAPGVVVAQVGDPNGDHNCWQRPEDMGTPRTTYSVDKQNPGSEVTAEIAAALAASSIAFKSTDANYSQLLLSKAMQVFHFANTYRGSYNDSIGQAACPFYCSSSGYMDELLWAAAWLYKATKVSKYWNFVKENVHYISGGVEFGWDSKHAGINVLFSQWVMSDPNNASPFVPSADSFVCTTLPDSPDKAVSYSPGGLLFKIGGSNMQHVTTLSFLLVVYAHYMKAGNKVVNCGNVVADPSKLINVARTQVDYILGSNPLGMSYMVGYGQKFPQKIHHRGSVLPSIVQHPQHIQCHDGDNYFTTSNPNPNILTGAVVGGPAQDDSFKDSRYDVAQSEPTTYINAPFVGVLAYFNKAS